MSQVKRLAFRVDVCGVIRQHLSYFTLMTLLHFVALLFQLLFHCLFDLLCGGRRVPSGFSENAWVVSAAVFFESDAVLSVSSLLGFHQLLLRWSYVITWSGLTNNVLMLHCRPLELFESPCMAMNSP